MLIIFEITLNIFEAHGIFFVFLRVLNIPESQVTSLGCQYVCFGMGRGFQGQRTLENKSSTFEGFVCFCGTEDQTQGLVHGGQTLNH
jgi:hypothetical protein